MDVEKISSYQVFCLLFVSIVSTVAVFFPPMGAGKDGWLSGLLASGYNLVLVGIIFIYFIKAPGKSIIQLLESYPIIKFIVTLITSLYLIILNALTIADLRENVALFMLPETPVVVTVILAMSLVIFLVKYGIEVLGRVAEFILPITFFTIILASIFSYPNVEMENFTPILEMGWGPAFLGSFHVFDFIGFLFVLLFLGHKVNRPSKIYKPLLAIVIIVAFSLLNEALVVVGVLGEGLLEQKVFPIMAAVKYSSHGAEAPLLTMWLSTMIVKIALVTYVFIELITQAFALKKKESFAMPFVIISVALSFVMFPNLQTLFEFGNMYTYFAITVQFLIPLLLLPFLLFQGKLNAKP